MRRSLRRGYAILRANSHVFVIALICLALWMLNARSSQLDASNARLNESIRILRERNVSLYSRNDTMAHTLNNLSNKVGDLNSLLADETQRRADAEQKASQLQRDNEFLRDQKGCSIAIDPKAVEKGKKDASSVIIQAAPADKQ